MATPHELPRKLWFILTLIAACTACDEGTDPLVFKPCAIIYGGAYDNPQDCPQPAKPDTVKILQLVAVHDTVRVPSKADTVTIRIPSKPDTVRLPGRVDTVNWIQPAKPDTVIVRACFERTKGSATTPGTLVSIPCP